MVDTQLIAGTYPNIAAMLDSMPPNLQMMCVGFMASGDAERLHDLEALLPSMIAQQNAGDFAGLLAILEMLGIDTDTARQLIDMAQHAANS